MTIHESRTPSRRRQWLKRIIILVFGGVALAITSKYDMALMRWRYETMPAKPSATAQQVLDGFRNFSQIISILMFIVMIAALDPRRRLIITGIVAAQISSGIVYNSVKYTVAHDRPYKVFEAVPESADHKFDAVAKPTFMWNPVNFDRSLQSFPSGHSAAAFALAGVLAYFYKKLRYVIWFMAFACAFSRFLEAQHWLTDCIAGSLIGYACVPLALMIAQRLGGKLDAIPPRPKSEPIEKQTDQVSV